MPNIPTPADKAIVDAVINRLLLLAGAHENGLTWSLFDQITPRTVIKSATATSHVASPGDGAIFMSNAAARTVQLPGASPAGTIFQVIDNSGTANAANTITISAASGTINGGANTVITPGTNKTCTVISDGANYFVLDKI